ncbi:hypothetical protein [Intrasporangium sp. DVR]|uniref:hypothetical protein n=1 Tax=Intrasporangium sp. DVR TaxID=3127867 RepID=UPI00313A66A5
MWAALTFLVARGRVLGGSLALAGVLALVPSVFWPTMSLTQPGVMLGDGKQRDLVNLEWSWGQYAFLGAPEEMGPSEMSNPWGLAYLVLMLVVGASGAVAWLVVPGLPGRLLGAAGTAVLGSYVAHIVVERQSEQSLFYGSENVILRGTPPAGRFEQGSLVLLALGLLVMLWSSLVIVARRAWAAASALAATARGEDEATARPVDDPRAGGVILHGERTGDRPLPPRAPRTAPAEPVGFTDPTPDDHDFGPPSS